MYSVALISDVHDWHSDQIEINLKRQDCRVFRVKYNDLDLSLHNSKKRKLNSNFKKFHGVWSRFIGNGSIEEITTKLTFLHLMEEMGIYVHNSAKIIEQTVDKVRTTGLLNLNEILTPNTFVRIGNVKNFKLKKKHLIKPIFGSQGKNIFLLNKSIDLKKIRSIGNVFYLQEFLQDPKKKKFWDLRILVSNHKIISIMKRISKNFITNVYQGAETEIILNNKKINEIATKVSKVFNLSYGGIDIIYHKRKYYVLEVNSVPSWKALQKLETKDISKILVKDFLRNLKRKCRVNC